MVHFGKRMCILDWCRRLARAIAPSSPLLCAAMHSFFEGCPHVGQHTLGRKGCSYFHIVVWILALCYSRSNRSPETSPETVGPVWFCSRSSQLTWLCGLFASPAPWACLASLILSDSSDPRLTWSIILDLQTGSYSHGFTVDLMRLFILLEDGYFGWWSQSRLLRRQRIGWGRIGLETQVCQRRMAKEAVGKTLELAWGVVVLCPCASPNFHFVGIIGECTNCHYVASVSSLQSAINIYIYYMNVSLTDKFLNRYLFYKETKRPPISSADSAARYINCLVASTIREQQCHLCTHQTASNRRLNRHLPRVFNYCAKDDCLGEKEACLSW